MRAEEVHRILRQAWGESLGRRYWRRTASNTASWRRPITTGGYMFFCVYISWAGYDEKYGCWFRIELAIGPTKHLRDVDPSSVDSYLGYLNVTDRALLLAAVNEAHRDIPGLGPRTRFTGDDLNYYQPEHVERYGAVLLDMLPRIISGYAIKHSLILANSARPAH